MSEIDILSEEFVAEANEELKTKPCPAGCGAVGQGEVVVRYAATPNHSLSGTQIKVSAVKYLHYLCRACGIEGRLSA